VTQIEKKEETFQYLPFIFTAGIKANIPNVSESKNQKNV
jgi:hypothetical protein